MAAAWRVLRNNWKKTVFFTAVAAFGCRYVKRKYEESEILREYCLQAVKYGNDTLKTSERPRKVIVFLNPAAKKSTARRQFEKNVLPLLNLAGLEVNVVKTEHEGQAKAFMSVLDDNIVDAVVVAGGDGTVSEIVTGLLRRNDKFVDRTPVGVIPVGTTNTLARLLFPLPEGDDALSDTRLLCEAGMAVVRNVTKPVDVIEIKGKVDKPPVYAVSHLKWGLYTDTEKEKSKYWYFGPLKQWYSFVHKAWQAWPEPQLPAAHLTFSPPCDGCSRCYAHLKGANGAVDSMAPTAQLVASSVQQPWWRRLAGSGVRPTGSGTSPIAAVEDQRATRSNPLCGTERALDVKTFELCLLSSNHQASPSTSAAAVAARGDSSEMSRKLDLTFVTSALSKADFIKFRKRSSSDSGADPRSYGPDCPATMIHAGSITITPMLPQEAESWFTIDSESYEAMPTSVKVIQSALRFFCSAPDRARQVTG